VSHPTGAGYGEGLMSAPRNYLFCIVKCRAVPDIKFARFRILPDIACRISNPDTGFRIPDPDSSSS